jgi:hypothetical protein
MKIFQNIFSTVNTYSNNHFTETNHCFHFVNGFVVVNIQMFDLLLQVAEEVTDLFENQINCNCHIFQEFYFAVVKSGGF